MDWRSGSREAALTALSLVPYAGGPIVRLIDNWAADARTSRVESNIAALLERLRRNEETLASLIEVAMDIGLGEDCPLPGLRRARSCMVILKALNTSRNSADRGIRRSVEVR
ncbi:MAG TPA: hypothetical protein VEB21_15745 [Terriglobales bacterium]|nr:hypothetical protein [Terriglobales bacterium]